MFHPTVFDKSGVGICCLQLMEKPTFVSDVRTK